MKIFHAAFATLLITGSMFLQPAHAQSTPQEYRTSCIDARVEDREDNGALTYAVTGNQWRRTVAGKDALLAPHLKGCSLLA
jgi:hypothetical protein